MTEPERPGTSGRCGPGCPTCADLRRAVVALVGTMGLESATPDRLRQVAGLSAEELAAHACGDVDACVAAAYEELVEGLQARYRARLRRAADRDEGLRAATGDLLAHLARHGDAAAFVAVEVTKGGRELLELREALRRRSVADVRRELARFDGGVPAPELQVEMLLATIGHVIVRHVDAGRTSELAGALEPALAMAGACLPLLALT